jgi:hypothetical protein
MAPRWTVIVEIDPGLAGALRQQALGAIATIAEAAHVEVRDRSSAALVGFASDRVSADRFAQSVREIEAVTAAYVKPPELLP